MTNGYKQAYRSNQFTGMPPERITLALLDGALAELERAQDAFDHKDVPLRGESIGRALAIICELQNTLDLEKGGELGHNLHELYGFMIRELLQANLRADPSKLPTVKVPLKEIRDGWAEMIAAQLTPASVGNAPIKAYL